MLGALQTDHQHYAKGYATAVVKGIAKKIAQRGHDIYAGVNEMNTPSRRLFEKAGFVSVGNVRWIFVQRFAQVTELPTTTNEKGAVN